MKEIRKSVVLFNTSEEETYSEYKSQVIAGLSKSEKTLPFKFNYDEEGSQILSKIQQTPEYYLWRCDKDILEQKGGEMLKMIGEKKFNLIDLGAGDATKTRVLIKKALDQGYDIEYVPIDISYHANMGILEEFAQLFPTLKITALTSLFDEGMKWVKDNLTGKNAYFFVGSTFGNSGKKQNRSFVQTIYKNMKEGDQFFVGVDLWKNPETITRAYLDNQFEKPFLKNNLKRINKELKGNFNVDQFYPYTYFDPFKRLVHGMLVSSADQKAEIDGTQFTFRKSEPIKIFISRKWVMSELKQFFVENNFKEVGDFIDHKEFFGYAVFKKQ